MSTNSVEWASVCRQHMETYNEFVLLLWRLGLGQWIDKLRNVFGRTMVISHTESVSGRTYRTPVIFAEIEGQVYCLALAGTEADWCHNVKANPAVEVWLPDGWWAAEAEELADGPSRLPLMRQVLIGGGKVSRCFGLTPGTMTDEELKQALGDAHLFRISKTEARTGAGGPGDLAWVWPLTTLVLVLATLFRRRR